jgi:hypothetical protein
MAVSVIIVAGMFRIYGVYNERIRHTAAGAQVSSLAESARNATYGKKNVKAPLTAKLAAQGKDTLDPWGSPIEVTSGGKCIEIEFSHLARKDCLYLSRTIKSDCKEHVASVNGAPQPAGLDVDFAGECNKSENSIKWFFAK